MLNAATSDLKKNFIRIKKELKSEAVGAID